MRALLLLNETAGAALNMAVDEALLIRAASTGDRIMRIYSWTGPSLTLGRFQRPDDGVNRRACARLGLPVVRRITGGRAVIHGWDVTVSIAAPLSALGAVKPGKPRARDVYRQVNGILSAALSAVGVSTRASGSEGGRPSAGDCFATMTAADLADAGTGAKALGGALCIRDACFLLQASIPVAPADECEAATRRAVFGMDAGRPGNRPNRAAVLDALADAARAAWSGLVTAHREAEIDPCSVELFRRTRYDSPAWTERGHGLRTLVSD